MEELKNRAIQAIRKDPRGGKHWKFTNKYLDEVIKNSLKKSPFLQYDPRAWLPPLYQSYFNLRSHYWGAFYEMVLKNHENPFINLYGWIDIKILLYIRILSILIRICVDRICDSKYRKLSALPAMYYHGPFIFGIAIAGFMNNIENYLNEISNDLFTKINDFFIEVRGPTSTTSKESLSYGLLFPIPTSDYPEYISFLKDINQKYSDKFSGQDKEKINGNLTMLTPAYVEFLLSPQYGPEILLLIIEFLRNIYKSYNGNSDEIDEICTIYQYIFPLIPPDDRNVSVIDTNYFLDIFSRKYPNISKLDTYIYDPTTSSVNLADIEHTPEIFIYSYDLFDKPFVKLPQGIYTTSIFWLYDSFIYKFTRLMNKPDLGRIRGVRAENYFGFLIENTLQNYKLEKIRPFKLIIRNSEKKMGVEYSKLKSNLTDFKFSIYEIDIEGSLIHKDFFFYEIDCALCYRKQLLLIEVKDDLFWDVRDIPYFYLLWHDNIHKKLEKIKDLIKQKAVKLKISAYNIEFESVNILTLTQPHFAHYDYTTIHDIEKQVLKLLTGNDYLIFKNDFPSYPYK